MTRALLGKELKVIWASPLPYGLAAVFHATFGVLAWGQVVGRGQALFQPVVPITGFLLLLVAPIITSRAVAEEIRTGTLELLLAIPVATGRLVMAKYAAALLTLIALLMPMGVFVLLLYLYGTPDAGPIFAGVLGLLLLSGALSGIGVLTSSLTSSQPVAAILGLFAVLGLWFAHTGSEALAIGGLLGGFSLSERLRGFAGGVVDYGDVAFFVSVVAFTLTGARVVVESRRWR